MEDQLVFDYVEPTYVAKYDTVTGVFLSIGPAPAFEGEPNIISISKELLIDIGDGKIKMHNCIVDPFTQEIDIINKKKITDKDFILHRIPIVRYGGEKISEIYLTYDPDTQTLDIEMSQIYKGTKRFFDQEQFRNLYMHPTTEINFFVTNWNDPHVIHKLVRFPIEELIGNKKQVKVNNLPKKFSVYTKKVFKKYLLEIKDEDSRV